MPAPQNGIKPFISDQTSAFSLLWIFGIFFALLTVEYKIINLKIKMKHIINLTLLLIFTTVFKLEIFTQIQLPAPNLIYPEHAQGFEFAPTEFKWHKISDAQFYKLEITTDVTFLNFNNETDIVRDFVIDTVFFTNSLKIDTVYFWRVVAKTLDTVGELSFIRYFITGDKSNVFEKLNAQTEISIFPMPIKEQAKILINSKRNFNTVSTYLFALDGQFIDKLGENFVSNEGTSEINFDVSRYGAGHYTMFLIDEKSEIIAAKTIIIQR